MQLTQSQIETMMQRGMSLEQIKSEATRRGDTLPDTRSGFQKTLDVGTNITNALGLGGIAEQFGASSARAKLNLQGNNNAAQLVENPSFNKVAGSALVGGSMLIPGGGLARGITSGFRGLGLSAGTSALGKLGAGATIGFAADAGFDIQDGRSVTPGLGTAISTVIPGFGIGMNALGRSLGRNIPGFLSYTSEVPEQAFKTLIERRGSVVPQIGVATPESVLTDTQVATRALRKTITREWEDGVNAIIPQFKGKRLGLNDAEIKALERIEDQFGIEMPVNPRNMSVNESLNLMKEINELYNKRLVREAAGGITVRKFKEAFKPRMISTFGGRGGPVERLYANYSSKKSVFDAAESLVKAYSTGKPIQQATALGRLKALFNENKGAYLNAIIDLERATGKDLLSGITATKFTPTLPNTRQSISASGGLESGSSVFDRAMRIMLLPLTSPRFAGLIARNLAKIKSPQFTLPGDRFMQTATGQRVGNYLKESLRQGPTLSIEDVSKKNSRFLRGGQSPIGNGATQKNGEWVPVDEIVARERFNIPALEKISFGGSDRDVYNLGNGMVLKVSKSSRGLDQNISDYYAEDIGLVPKTIEKGRNYIVKEMVNPPDVNVKNMVSELKQLHNLRSRGHYAQEAFWREKEQAREIFNKYGYNGDGIMDYDPLWGDFQAIRNWGTRDGVPIMLDEGSLNGNLITRMSRNPKGGPANLLDPEFRAIHTQSRVAKKKFGDTDKKTMYGIAGATPIMISQKDE